jgi:hypothetical protein
MGARGGGLACDGWIILGGKLSFVVVVVSAAYSLIRQPTVGEGPHGIIAPRIDDGTLTHKKQDGDIGGEMS